MKKINRLLKNKDFKQVLDSKKSVASKELVVYYKENKEKHLRIGISVSSKIGNSVVRHKIKRQINEMLKELVNVFEEKDLIIIVRNKYLDNSFIENKKILQELLIKTKKGEKK